MKEEHRKNMQTCNYSTTLDGDKWCQFEVDQLGSRCSKAMKFGYEVGNPCIIVKLNNIFDWKPETYKTSDDLPKNMPEDVKAVIERDFTEADSNKVSDEQDNNEATTGHGVGQGRSRHSTAGQRWVREAAARC